MENNISKNMKRNIPKWMEIASNPDSIGGKLLDVLGIEINELYMPISCILQSNSLDNSNLTQSYFEVDYIYKVFLERNNIDDEVNISYLNYDNEYIPSDLAKNIYQFYFEGDGFYLDIDEYILYSRKKYTAIKINDIIYTEDEFVLHHVWGPLDEIGLLFNLPRLEAEENDSYRQRLLDVYKNLGNATHSGLINHISRKLNIASDKVKVNSLSDDEYVSTLLDEKGNPTKELEEYIKISKNVNAFSSDNYWEILNEDRKGLKYLPIVWKANLDSFSDYYIQNGIGDNDDLKITLPEIQSRQQDFNYAIYAEGLNYPDKAILPEHKFKLKITADGYCYDTSFSPEKYNFTMIASELLNLKFDVRAESWYTRTFNTDFINETPEAIGESSSSNPMSDKYLISDNLTYKTGDYVTNQSNRYLQVLANLKSSPNRYKSPTLQSITIKYTKNGTQHTILLNPGDEITTSGNTTIIGFNSTENWNTTPSTNVRFSLDSEDSENITKDEDGNYILTKGDYNKEFASADAWEDGINNPNTHNIMITSRGTIKLNI